MKNSSKCQSKKSRINANQTAPELLKYFAQFTESRRLVSDGGLGDEPRLICSLSSLSRRTAQEAQALHLCAVTAAITAGFGRLAAARVVKRPRRRRGRSVAGTGPAAWQAQFCSGPGSQASLGGTGRLTAPSVYASQADIRVRAAVSRKHRGSVAVCSRGGCPSRACAGRATRQVDVRAG